MNKNNKPKRDVLVSHKDNLKELSIKHHDREFNYRGDIRKSKTGLVMEIKIEE